MGLTEIQQNIKKRVKPLLVLVFKANEQIDLMTKSGYKVEIQSWASSGYYGSSNDIRLVGCIKDIIRNESLNRSASPLKTSLAKVTMELKCLEKEGYCLDVTAKRPNGHIAIFVKSIHIGLIDNDFGMCQIP